MEHSASPHIQTDKKGLMQTIRHRLDGEALTDSWGDPMVRGKIKGSAVLFLLTLRKSGPNGSYEPCLLLNKRSAKVLQPGDLCCPGGGVAPLDRVLSAALHLPLSPLGKWPAWRKWKRSDRQKANGLALLLATALREAWEEMRLNPLKVSFLGPLQVQRLIMFNRRIFPLAGWVPRDQNLVPNWEVARIVHIPLRRFFETRRYARYRLTFNTAEGQAQRKEDFPCFIHNGCEGDEILWGATFRITVDFLQRVFGFIMPDLGTAPIITRRLGSTYFNGSSALNRSALRTEQRDDD